MDEYKRLRKRLLDWHYKKAERIDIVDLLDSDYQSFRNKVSMRIGKGLDFRDAIKRANVDELQMLDITRLEKRLKI